MRTSTSNHGPRRGGSICAAVSSLMMSLVVMLGLCSAVSGVYYQRQVTTTGAPVETLVLTGDNTTSGVVHEGEYYELWYTVNVATYPAAQYDLHITLDVLHGDADLLVKGPKWFKRTSTHATGSDVLFVSRDTIAELCEGEVVCMFRMQIIGHAPVSGYEFVFDIEKKERVIHSEEQAVLESIYSECCTHNPLSIACNLWSRAVAASETTDQLVNFCHLPGQVCNSAGRLTQLDLRWSYAKCPLPTGKLSKLVKLERLLFQENDFSGTFKSIQSLASVIPGLKHVHLRNNKLSGALSCCPAGQWGCMDHLKTLDLEGNDFDGSIPECLFGLPDIGVLSLRDNRLDGSLPDEMPYTSSISVLDLSDQRGGGLTGWGLGGLSGTLPDFSPLETLIVLRLDGNKFSGSIPALPFDLEELDLSGNQLEGPLHDSLRLLKRLRTLDLSHNHLSGTIHKELASTTPRLEQIDLSSNSLSGEVPEEWKSDVLREINLSSNLLSGAIPGGLATWDGLQLLNLSNNSLSGSLKNFLSNMKTTHIRQLLLSDNHLTGPLSEGLTMVEAISLRQNYGARLPQILDLSFNLFDGPFPRFLLDALVRLQAVWPYAITVDLQGNYLDCPDNATTSEIQADFPALSTTTCLDSEADNLRTFTHGLMPAEVLEVLEMDPIRPRVALAESAAPQPAPPSLVPAPKSSDAILAGLVDDELARENASDPIAGDKGAGADGDDAAEYGAEASESSGTPTWVIYTAIVLCLLILGVITLILVVVSNFAPRPDSGPYKEHIDTPLDPGTDVAIEMA